MDNPKHTIREVSDFFLSKIDKDSGDTISPLKLQKLVYYAQAWHYTIFDKPLFKGKIQAWTHGPAVKSLYGRFYHQLRNDAIAVQGLTLVNVDFEPKTKSLLNEVYDIYGEHSGSYLEKLTHSEDPWTIAREGYLPHEACAVEITLESMKEYYSKKFGKQS